MTKKDGLDACERMKKLAAKNMDDPLFVELHNAVVESEEVINNPLFDIDDPACSEAIETMIMIAAIIESMCQDQLDLDEDE